MDTKSIEIKLFLLTRTETPHPDEWAACIVAAKDEAAAREQANQDAPQVEGYVWTDGHKVHASFLGMASDGVSGVILGSKTLPGE